MAVGASRALCYSCVPRGELAFSAFRFLSGRSAAWLARLVRDQEVEGSNPFAPTTPKFTNYELLTYTIVSGRRRFKPLIGPTPQFRNTFLDSLRQLP